MTRQVLLSFVATQPKMDREDYNYSSERAGVIQMEMAPQYWIWRPITNAEEVRRRLEGLLSLVVQVLSKEDGAQLVDIRDALADVERLLPQARHRFRPAMLSFYFLFNLLLAPEQRSSGFDAFFEQYAEEAGQPAVETIVVATLLGATDDWRADVYAKTLEQYFHERIQKQGLHAPRLAEAAMCLALADKYRQEGNPAGAKAQLVRAFEVHPGHAGLRALIDGDLPEIIAWRDILLPPAQPGPEESADAQSTS